MVLSLTVLSYVYFSFIYLLNMSEWEHLIKVLQYLYRVLSLVSSIAHARWSKQFNTLTLGRVAKASPFPEVFAKGPSKLVEQVFFCLSHRVTMAWGPLHRECQEFQGICTQDGMVTPEINVLARSPISHPLHCELTVSRMKDVGVKLSWPVICFEPHQCDQYLHCQNTDIDFHTPLIPLH